MTLLVHGVKVPIKPEEVSPTIWRALSNGTYEAQEARWAVRSVRPGDRVLELGSGIGIITALLSEVEGAQVWAFEASPASVRLAHRVLEANGVTNVTLVHGILASGAPRDVTLYVREDLWMTSTVEHQGAYQEALTVRSADIDRFVSEQRIDLIVMDIEGAERDLLVNASLPGVERIFLELHDHLYGLAGIRDITQALASKGFAYDPRGSSGACVLFSRNQDARVYEAGEPHG